LGCCCPVKFSGQTADNKKKEQYHQKAGFYFTDYLPVSVGGSFCGKGRGEAGHGGISRFPLGNEH
jgi:hypothetical protein